MQEVQTSEFGFGFDGILRRRRDDLVGILNGIDTAEWDPAHDLYLPAPYEADDLSGKAVAKAEVLARYRLSTDEAAMRQSLVGIVSRMVDQKGFDLLAALADRLPHLGASFLVLGMGETRYQDLWTHLINDHPDRIGARIGFEEGLAHLVERGPISSMPLRFEPWGLNQMYSLRYDTVPVARAVGGLANTVSDYAPPPPGQSPAARPGAVEQDSSSTSTPRKPCSKHLNGRWRSFRIVAADGSCRPREWHRIFSGTVLPASTSRHTSVRFALARRIADSGLKGENDGS